MVPEPLQVYFSVGLLAATLLLILGLFDGNWRALLKSWRSTVSQFIFVILFWLPMAAVLLLLGFVVMSRDGGRLHQAELWTASLLTRIRTKRRPV